MTEKLTEEVEKMREEMSDVAKQNMGESDAKLKEIQEVIDEVKSKEIPQMMAEFKSQALSLKLEIPAEIA